jgi:hypothetical protein
MNNEQPQADRLTFKWKRIDSADANRVIAPVNGFPLGNPSTTPDLTSSPFTVSKMPTTGLALQLQAPGTGVAAVANAGGFGIIVWVRDPATGQWSSFASVSMAYAQLFVTFDIDAADLWFQLDHTTVAVDGKIDVGIAEQ